MVAVDHLDVLELIFRPGDGVFLSADMGHVAPVVGPIFDVGRVGGVEYEAVDAGAVDDGA